MALVLIGFMVLLTSGVPRPTSTWGFAGSEEPRDAVSLLGAFRTQLDSRLYRIDSEPASARLVELAMTSLDATGAEMALHDGPKRVRSDHGQQPASPTLTVEAAEGDASATLSVGPREDGLPHPDQSRVALQQTLDTFVRAIADG